MKRFVKLLRRISHIPHRLYWETRMRTLSAYFQILSFSGRAAITRSDGPVVSLTSYGRRIRTVHLAIESIGRGRLLPSRVILWLNDDEALRQPTAALQRLVRRGLEIRFCPDYGPHKKYYPYLESLSVFETPLVTADDDLLYPSTWLEKLVAASEQFPDVVNCYRARVMEIEPIGKTEYGNWRLATTTEPSFRHVAGNGAGVLYPTQLQSALQQAGTAFMNCCPMADDLWLHLQTIREGYRVRQISRSEFTLVEIPATQQTALWRQNACGGGNDRQIAATYTAKDIQRIKGDKVSQMSSHNILHDRSITYIEVNRTR